MSNSTPSKPNLLKLVGYEHPILRQALQPITFPLSKEDQQLINDMKYSILGEQLKKANAPWEAAAGMAANQWGLRKRIFLFCPEHPPEEGVEVIINPSYKPLAPPTENETLIGLWETCFSVPLATGYVARYPHIQVTYQNEAGDTLTRELSGWVARVWQHENDHLDGFLYDDPRTGKCCEKQVFSSLSEYHAFFKKLFEQP